MKLKLVDGEYVVIRTRPHPRVLLSAVVNFLFTLTVMSFLLAYISRGSQPDWVQEYGYFGTFAVWAAGILSLVFNTGKPIIEWLLRFTYVTNLRVVQKNLLISPRPLVIPLGLVSEMRLQQSRVQSMSGSGNLVLMHGAYGQTQKTVLQDMPDAEKFHQVLSEQLSSYRKEAAEQHQAFLKQNQPRAYAFDDTSEEGFSGVYRG